MDKILEFSPVMIKNASIQPINNNEEAKRFGCMGTLEAETEVREIIKNCEGDERVITIPRYMTVNIGGHVKRDVLRDIFGLNTDNLSEGVYSYGLESKGKRFAFTADVIDEFENIVQLIAFPRCSNMTGLSISIDNDADEVAYMELELRANADDLRNFYYEAFVDEVDEEIREKWHREFTPKLISTPEA